MIDLLGYLVRGLGRRMTMESAVSNEISSRCRQLDFPIGWLVHLICLTLNMFSTWYTYVGSRHTSSPEHDTNSQQSAQQTPDSLRPNPVSYSSIDASCSWYRTHDLRNMHLESFLTHWLTGLLHLPNWSPSLTRAPKSILNPVANIRNPVVLKLHAASLAAGRS